MSRKIGVSVISLLPWSLGKDGLARAVAMAIKSGFDGVQALPMRGWDELSIRYAGKNQIISFEDVWNSFYDRILFGGCAEAEKRLNMLFAYFGETAMFVTHDWMRPGLLEFNPETGVPANGHFHYCDFCWDTKHVIRPGRHGELPVTNNWRDFLRQVAPDICLIHVNESEGSADPEMLKALAKTTDCPVIYEAMPPFVRIFCSPLGAKEIMLKWLKERRAYLSEFFG